MPLQPHILLWRGPNRYEVMADAAHRLFVGLINGQIATTAPRPEIALRDLIKTHCSVQEDQRGSR